MSKNNELLSSDGLFSYLVAYGGGIGPDVWDGELVVKAKSVRDALDQTEAAIQDDGGEVYLVEQQ